MVKRRCRRHRPGSRDREPSSFPGRKAGRMAEATRTERVKEPPTLELVLKRNPVERLKREKSPLSMLAELPALIATGYADIEEEDLVRLKWWGLYHDKPKVGTFMLRIKLPAGRVTPEQLRAVGELSNEHGRGAGELTTRQTIQLHYLELGSLPTVFDRLRCGRADDGRGVRRRRPQPDRLPRRRARARRALRRDRAAGRGDRVLLRQPGLLRPSAQAQDLDLRLRPPLQRAGDQLHLPRRRHPRRRARVRGARRRRPLVRAADRARARRVDPRRRGDARPPRAPRRLEGGPALPGLAREGAPQVHGRRLRPRGHARGGRAAARLRAPRLRARAARPRAGRPHGRRAGARPRPRARSACRSISV